MLVIVLILACACGGACWYVVGRMQARATSKKKGTRLRDEEIDMGGSSVVEMTSDAMMSSAVVMRDDCEDDYPQSRFAEGSSHGHAQDVSQDAGRSVATDALTPSGRTMEWHEGEDDNPQTRFAEGISHGLAQEVSQDAGRSVATDLSTPGGRTVEWHDDDERIEHI